MTLQATIDGIARRALAAGVRVAFVAPLATRVVLGLTFVQTGWGKWHHFAGTAAYFSSLRIPFPAANAALVATLELVGGGALIAGLLTRVFAAGLSVSMTVALLTADREAFLASWSRASSTSPTDVTSFVFLLFLLWLGLQGPGAVSLDRWLWRRLTPVAGASPAASRPPAFPAPRGGLTDRTGVTPPGAGLEENRR